MDRQLAVFSDHDYVADALATRDQTREREEQERASSLCFLPFSIRRKREPPSGLTSASHAKCEAREGARKLLIQVLTEFFLSPCDYLVGRNMADESDPFTSFGKTHSRRKQLIFQNSR